MHGALAEVVAKKEGGTHVETQHIVGRRSSAHGRGTKALIRTITQQPPQVTATLSHSLSTQN